MRENMSRLTGEVVKAATAFVSVGDREVTDPCATQWAQR